MTTDQLKERRRELEVKIKQLHAQQMSLKVLVNSAYGLN